MGRKALTKYTLPEAELLADLAEAERIGNTAVGHKALYLPGKLLAARGYIPLTAVQRAYLRLVVGERKHGNFRQPLLVLIVDGREIVYLYGKEQQVRDILFALEARGVATGKPKPPKPN